jgi:hypothetical protein
MINLVSGPPVPDHYIGVWKRTLLRAPAIDDTTSQVHWMQTRSWHADIRVPAGRPVCQGKTSPGELSREELLGLARQQGFCGTTLVEGDTCRWLRRFDFQPPSGANDVGRMVFDTPDRVFEYGVEADYFEIWERMPGSGGEPFSVELAADPLTLLLVTGKYFMTVRPRAGTLPQAENLAAHAAQASDTHLAQMLDFEIAFGTRSDTDVWRIGLSTLPWREGTVLQNTVISATLSPP